MLRPMSNSFLGELISLAESRGVQVSPVLTRPSFYRFSYCDVSRLVASTLTDLDSYMGSVVCSNKILSHPYLISRGLLVPLQVDLSEVDNGADAMAHVGGFPCVVKPSSGERGLGVTVNILDQDRLCAAVDHALSVDCGIPLLQNYVTGKSFRITVLKGEILFAARLIPAERGVPVNFQTGSEVQYCTEQLHPQTAADCIGIARDLGMHCIGIDLITEDIAGERPTFLEINSSPRLLPHRAEAFLNSLGFPGLSA